MGLDEASREDLVFKARVDVGDSPRLALVECSDAQHLSVTHSNSAARWARRVGRANQARGIDDVVRRR